MAKFIVEKLNRGRIRYVCSFDPSIDWDSTEFSEKEYQESPLELCTSLKFFEGQAPIYIYFHFPTHEELMIALQEGNLDFSVGDKSGDRTIVYKGSVLNPGLGAEVGYSLALRQLSSLCISKVENLDGFPSNCKVKNNYNLEELSKEAISSLGPEVIQKAILTEIGSILIEGKPSEKS